MARRSRPFRILRLASIALGVALFGVVLFFASLPSAEPLVRENPPSTAFIDAYRERGEAAPRWTWVPWSAISDELKVAVVAGEDMSFFSHHGYDAHEIRQSLRRAWDEKRPPRGASTITQQLARNMWLAPKRSYLRKLRELVLARRLEAALSKRRILEIYLNVIELGPGLYGVEAAARHYYGAPASALGREAAASLAALLPQPSLGDVHSSNRAYQARRRAILARSEQATWIRRLL